MKKVLTLSIAVSLSLFVSLSFAVEKTKGRSGEALFKQHCAVCHPDGGNIINPSFTLHKKELGAHGITKPKGIINKMRNPGPGMTKFDRKTIPDAEAKEIAEYILGTFK
jgi:cytochrome c6